MYGKHTRYVHVYTCTVQQYCLSHVFNVTHVFFLIFYYRSFKALLKLPNLDKTLHQLSSTHNITPLLEVFVPQLVSNGVKNVLAEPEQSDFYMKPLLEISLDLLKNLDFDRSMVVAIGRSVLLINR